MPWEGVNSTRGNQRAKDQMGPGVLPKDGIYGSVSLRNRIGVMYNATDKCTTPLYCLFVITTSTSWFGLIVTTENPDPFDKCYIRKVKMNHPGS